MLARRSSYGLGFASVADQETTSVGVDPSQVIGNTGSTVTVDIPGIYRDPGGIISSIEQTLCLALGTCEPPVTGTGAGAAAAKPTTNYMPWLVAAAVGVGLVMAARR